MSDIAPCGNAECDKTVTQSLRGRSRKYCSSRCRTATFRQTEADAQRGKSPVCPIEIIEEKGRQICNENTTAPESCGGSPEPGERHLTASATFVTARIGRPARHPKAIPDAIYAGMWRVRWPDGRLSDKANISRVNDAIADFMERMKGPP